MSYQFEKNPQAIEQESFRQIRELTDLSELSREQQQVVMRIVHTLGMPEIASQVFFSDNACNVGRKALELVTEHHMHTLLGQQVERETFRCGDEKEKQNVLMKASEDDTQLEWWYAHRFETHASRAASALRLVRHLALALLTRMDACRLVEVAKGFPTSSDAKRRTAIILPWDVRKGAGRSGGKLLQLALFNDISVHWSRIEDTTIEDTTNSALRLANSHSSFLAIDCISFTRASI